MRSHGTQVKRERAVGTPPTPTQAQRARHRWLAGIVAITSMLITIGAMPAQAHPVSASNQLDGLRWSILTKPNCPPRSCWQVRVTAVRTSCTHGLYVSLNQWTLADPRATDNVFLSTVTAVIPSLQRGATAIVTLPRTSRRAEGATLSEINCY